MLLMCHAGVSDTHEDWQEHISPLMPVYDNALHPATGYTRCLALFGWSPSGLRALCPLPDNGR
jgi:hypothetical protein